MSGVRLDILVTEEVIEHLADNLPRLLGVAVVEVDVKGVGVVLVPDAAFAAERRDAALGRSACSGEAHNVLRFGEDLSGLPNFFGVIHGFKDLDSRFKIQNSKIFIQMQSYIKKLAG